MRSQASNRHNTAALSFSRRFSHCECDLIALSPNLRPSSTLYERWTIAEDAAQPELETARVERDHLKFDANSKTWIFTKLRNAIHL
jgi:hypothetical protein